MTSEAVGKVYTREGEQIVQIHLDLEAIWLLTLPLPFSGGSMNICCGSVLSQGLSDSSLTLENCYLIYFE